MNQLPVSGYAHIRTRIAEIPFNTFFARAVLDRRVGGTVYTDDIHRPANVLVVHKYGMALLLGEGKNPVFNRWLYGFMLNEDNERHTDAWLQVFPSSWNERIAMALDGKIIPSSDGNEERYGDFVELNTRVNFSFDEKKFRDSFAKTVPADKSRIAVLNADTAMKVQGCVVPQSFWDTPEVFGKHAAAFSMIHDGLPVSTAFVAFTDSNYREIGIETAGDYRGRGYAFIAAGALIEFCLEQGWVPVWSCRKENAGSYRLACSLGFEPVLELPYYRLCKHC